MNLEQSKIWERGKERHLLLAGVVVLGLGAAALVLAHAVAHVDHALLAVAPAPLRGRLARQVEAWQLVAACARNKL